MVHTLRPSFFSPFLIPLFKTLLLRALILWRQPPLFDEHGTQETQPNQRQLHHENGPARGHVGVQHRGRDTTRHDGQRVRRLGEVRVLWRKRGPEAEMARPQAPPAQRLKLRLEMMTARRDLAEWACRAMRVGWKTQPTPMLMTSRGMMMTPGWVWRVYTRARPAPLKPASVGLSKGRGCNGTYSVHMPKPKRITTP